MIPDLTKAAKKAEGVLLFHRVDLNNIDPLPILEKFRNVLLISYDSSCNAPSLPAPMFVSDNQDSFTLVNKKDKKLQYIIIYNQSLPQDQLRLALARELGHVVLDHDGLSPEYIWSEEASCFAHHFLCPLGLIEQRKRRSKRVIHYRPKLGSTLWEMKSIDLFENIESVKECAAIQATQGEHRHGSETCYYTLDDVELVNFREKEHLTGWKDCYDVVVNGETVGYCGKQVYFFDKQKA